MSGCTSCAGCAQGCGQTAPAFASQAPARAGMNAQERLVSPLGQSPEVYPFTEAAAARRSNEPGWVNVGDRSGAHGHLNVLMVAGNGDATQTPVEPDPAHMGWNFLPPIPTPVYPVRSARA